MPRQLSLAPELYTNADSSVDARYIQQMRGQDHTPVPTDPTLPRFTLVVGPSPFTMPRGWEFFLTSPYEGASYISTVLHNAGYPVRIVDVRYTPDPLQAAYDQIIGQTDVLGVCTFEDNYPFCNELMSQVRENAPEIPIICGGSLVTSAPHLFMEHTACDVAVISEGEITILELMESYVAGRWAQELSTINGILYRGPEGEVKRTRPRGQMMDLDALPRMRLELWPQSQSPMGLQPQIISSYSRGCKMDCSFCYRTTPQVRAKSPEKMNADLSWLKSRYGIEFTFFVDLTFSSHRGQTIEMCDVIKDHDLRWTCLTRCADMDKPRIDAMREAGADIILYGVESLGSDVLREARKGNSENITVRAMRTTFDGGVRFGSLLIVGLPNESEESLNHMVKFAETYNHVTRVKYLSAMPGTTVYQQALQQGLMRSELDHINWLSIEQALHEDEFLNVSGLPERACRDAYKRIYDAYQPGPVMEFRHWPEHFEMFHPQPYDGLERSTSYAGQGWRARSSSAAAPLVPGSERFTLDRVASPDVAAAGSSLMACGAKKLAGGLVGTGTV
ncbi:B12-binding domain-containing radical SAM protein [Paractinoplanes hotanensis]|uniref:B12-binding domain-containing radical SAM protein n=1 Tax=Paractinoplanes hotanensis TaxID=2906497 RepID=A0ABT0YBX6_9ACTN|nr:radical SAM protein [Actinoplanes hotanensis]MCM4083547.1 B12-binding domain-containing radical SAM protein [Actinoplanes hotanensis]